MPMTPQERQLVDELFDKLASLENAPRDPDAGKAIADGQRRAPNAIYALVQTVLLQDEALKRADERIQQLEAGQAPQPQGGFLDNMRDTLFGGGQPQSGGRGSVPRTGESRGPMWNSGQVLGQGQGNGGGYGYGSGAQAAPPPAPAGGGGGSFLGTAAAAAAGVIGGSLLMNSMRGMFGGSGQQHGFGDQASLGRDSGNPWGGSSNSGGDLARDAGLNDIGKSNAGGSDNNYSRQGLFDQASNDSGHDSDDDDDDFDSDDFDGGGDSDYA